MKYIILLRGINVSGQKLIKMKELQSMLEKLKFLEVQTYIQSGNIILISKEEKEKTKKLVKDGIKKTFSYDVEVFVYDSAYFKKLIKDNPFQKNKDFDGKKMYISFLENKPEKAKVDELMKVNSNTDQLVFSNDRIFVYCPSGYGKTKFTNNLMESKLKVRATTRNWNTVNILLEMGTIKS